MTELYLNGTRVALKPSTAIKLTAQNVFFTKSASYTLDIELPVNVEPNRGLFGWIDRMDVSKEHREFDTRLVVDGIDTLVGIATITSVTEASVTVQLLGESAAHNYRNRLDGLYIDGLNLGDWREYIMWDGRPETILRWPKGIFYDVRDVDGSVYGHRYPFVTYPVRNSSADAVLNNILCCTWNGVSGIRVGVDYIPRISSEDTRSMSIVQGVAFQPYIWYLAKRIAKATGFELDDEDNALFTDPLFRKIFMVNANIRLNIAATLPHWSVNDWWQHLEDAFGLVTVADYANRRIRLVHRKDYFKADPADHVYIYNVVDQYTSEVGGNDRADISVSNVGYADHDSAPEDILSDFILSKADVNTGFADIDELNAWGAASPGEISKGTIYKCEDGRWYIYAADINGSAGFIEVHMLRPRITKPDTADIDISLKFVPAKYADHEVKILEMDCYSSMLSIISKDAYIGSMKIRILETPNESELYMTESGAIDIEALIKGDEDEDSSGDRSDIPDIIYIAIENEDGATNHAMAGAGDRPSGAWRLPHPIIRERDYALSPGGASVRVDAPYSLSLIPIEGQINLASATITGAPQIDTAVRHNIQFISTSIPDTSAVFVIRGRRYACESIEVDIDVNGLRQMMTGHFYEIL